MIRQIVLADQPVIRRKLKPVKRFDQPLQQLVQDLTDTVIFANGAGLAANQIGSDQQVFVVNMGPRLRVYINPKLKILKSRDQVIDEGCLSVPGYRGPVHRSTEVEITYDDLKGRRHKKIVKGFNARVLQHEFDHLQGKLYLDHIADRTLVQKVEPVRVVFFGSGEFAVPILVSLVGLNWTFDFLTTGVVTQPPRPVGRKAQLTPTPVGAAATHFGLGVLTPEKLDAKFLTELKRWAPDLIILADYGKLLPKAVLELPKYGALNLHPSLLPRYRGATPIQQAILNGDAKTGVTLMKMNPQLDAGGMLGQYETAIDPNDNYLTLRERLANLASIMIRDLLPDYISGELTPQDQPSEGVVAAPKIPADLGKIESGDSDEEIVRKVRALTPEPGVFATYKGKQVKILLAHLEDGHAVPDLLQIEGGKVVAWKDFKNGYPDFSLRPQS